MNIEMKKVKERVKEIDNLIEHMETDNINFGSEVR